MRRFEEYHPLVQAVYFAAILLISMFTLHPFVLFLSLIGAVSLIFVRRSRVSGRTIGFFLLLFFLMAVLNPLTNHRGKTVLFVLNSNPVTFEALAFGLTAGLMIICVCFWFISVTEILTSERLLYLFGTISPKFALMLSLLLRLIPMYGRKREQIVDSQRALGLFKEDNAIDSLRGHARVFSVMVSWALENGIVTADSMAARGYGNGKRTSYSIFRFRKTDAYLIGAEMVLSVLTIVALTTGALQISFYPGITMNNPGGWTYIGMAAFGILSLLPALLTILEEVRWKFLQSKI